jgi:hypothetical protein
MCLSITWALEQVPGHAQRCALEQAFGGAQHCVGAVGCEGRVPRLSGLRLSKQRGTRQVLFDKATSADGKTRRVLAMVDGEGVFESTDVWSTGFIARTLIPIPFGASVLDTARSLPNPFATEVCPTSALNKTA